MLAPVELRRMLLPLYAFNLEVARVPWLTKEALIAEMRLQWWRDALAEIAAGGPVRRHEVVAPLAAAVDRRGARDLDDLVEARRADIAGAPLDDRAALLRYLDRTAGTLLWTAARLAGAGDEPAIRDAGLAQGAAAWLRAAPDLAARGRQVFPPGEPSVERAALARAGLEALERFRQARVEPSARPVLLALVDTPATLRAALAGRDVGRPLNPLAIQIRLGWAALTGRI